MASIRKRPNGSFQATIYLGLSVEGKRIRKYLTRRTLKEAKIAAHDLELRNKILIGDGISGKYNQTSQWDVPSKNTRRP